MLARLLRLHPSTYKRLVPLSKEAEREGAYRVPKRLQAVVLNSEGQTSGELARILKAPRSKVSEWLQRYQSEGGEGLLEGIRVGADSQGAAIEGVGVAPALSERWSGRSAGRLSVGSAIGTDGTAAATVGRYSGQRSSGLRSGQRHMDVAHDRLGDRGGVRRPISPRSCAQFAASLGIFGAASAPHSGPRRCRGAGPLAPPDLSEP